MATPRHSACGSAAKGAVKCSSTSVQACLILLVCILLWLLAPSPHHLVLGSSPLVVGAATAAAGRATHHHHQHQHQQHVKHLQISARLQQRLQINNGTTQQRNTAAAVRPHQAPQEGRSHADRTQQQQKGPNSLGHLSNNTAPHDVDVVYLWVNGSDPLLQQVLDSFTPPGPDALDIRFSAARYDSSRDELRYSLRSLEQFMPWYRHLYIVTNGQVPSWLDVSNPRVTVVPHSTIFENAPELPTFNSNAIQTKLLNIPGLADSFIMMDDDWFLTAPWTLQDFIGEDGAQVVTGSGLAEDAEMVNPHLTSIRYFSGIFQEMFGPWNRTIPAHSPHFMQQHWLKKVMSQLSEHFRLTGVMRFRSDRDVIVAAVYQWYIDQFQPGRRQHAPDSRTGFMSLHSGHARGIALQALQDAMPPNRRTHETAQHHTEFYFSCCNHTEAAVAVAAAVEAAAAGTPGPSLVDFREYLLSQLESAWAQPGAKMMCLNDDISDMFTYTRSLLNPLVVDFLAHRYAKASPYELPSGAERSCRRLTSAGFGKLPTEADLEAACGTAAGSRTAAAATQAGLPTKHARPKRLAESNSV